MLNNSELLNFWNLDFRLRKTKEEYQYMLDIFQVWKKIWFLYFHKKPDKDLEFMWIYLEKDCRWQWLANIAMKYLEILSLEEFRSNVIKTQYQKKPLTSAILVKNWFNVMNWLKDEIVLYVWKIIWNDKRLTWVYSNNWSISDKVRKSTSFLERQYIVVVDRLNLLIPESVVKTWYRKKYIKELN